MKKPKLKPREQEALDLLLKGLRNRDIADKMSPPLSEGSVKNLLTKIYEKTGFTSRAELIVAFKEARLA